MLREIRCEKFRTRVVSFHPGLNVVLGDDNATNSIGKSTLLMLVDYVFGGSTLLTWNKDIVAELGHHHYDFAFEFDGELHRFRRETITPETVYICDADYKVLSAIQLDEFTAFLKHAYDLAQSGQTFRAAVGLHLRVWGKTNLIPDEPLHTFPKQRDKDCIDNLIKTYDKFEAIRARDDAARTADAELKVIRAAASKQLIPKVTKTGYAQAKVQIASLERDLEEVRQNLASYATSLSAVINKEVLELKERKDDLLQRHMTVAGRLQRIDRNLVGKRTFHGGNFQDLQKFFPEINTERLSEVEAFHDGVARILREQLKQSKEQLAEELKLIDWSIMDIDMKMATALGSVEQPESLVDHVYKVALSLQTARGSRDSYELEQSHVDARQKAKEALVEVKQRILTEIETSVNEEMREIVSEAVGEHRKSPHLSLDDTSYNFEVFEDTGTGTAYFGLVLFDMAVFRATNLPAIAHDSVLFKNISNDSVAHLVGLYAKIKKQSFIALDEIQKYGPGAALTLQKQSVIQLSDSAVLYIKDWRPSRLPVTMSDAV
ncbi:DUF2326 domain-containing protein [Chromobacterium sp. Beijing]|uniref:DUF2326 domain-containing protein n=1 Tax=Chromobacterium sp. Beijing TaxID=2735795 RepID=UPI001F290B79|nr:DUF2326 domain-containing protein [Chromobacterium sp. Beijing]UJB31504.1 DUF2326 domain-containing protein [Chromobacterium sp. Beijing]